MPTVSWTVLFIPVLPIIMLLTFWVLLGTILLVLTRVPTNEKPRKFSLTHLKNFRRTLSSRPSLPSYHERVLRSTTRFSWFPWSYVHTRPCKIRRSYPLSHRRHQHYPFRYFLKYHLASSAIDRATSLAHIVDRFSPPPLPDSGDSHTHHDIPTFMFMNSQQYLIDPCD